MFAFFRYMLCDFSEEIKGIKNLEISRGAIFQIAACRHRELAAAEPEARRAARSGGSGAAILVFSTIKDFALV